MTGAGREHAQGAGGAGASRGLSLAVLFGLVLAAGATIAVAQATRLFLPGSGPEALIPYVAMLSGASALALAAMAGSGRIAPTQMTVALMLLLGLVLRLGLFGPESLKDSDWHRYLWDGAVLAHGFDPYAQSPTAALICAPGLDPGLCALAREAGATLTRTNFPDLITIYPGAAQAVFALNHLLAPWDLNGLRTLFLIADLATLALLLAWLGELKLSPLWAGLYWCNPVAAFVLIHQIHVDGVMMPFVLGALLAGWRARPISAGALLGVAVGVKLWPVLLAPLVLRPMLLRPAALIGGLAAFLAVSAALTLPLALSAGDPASGLAAYSARWHFSNGLVSRLRWLVVDGLGVSPSALRLLLGGAVAVLALLAALPALGSARGYLLRALLVTAALFILSPAQFPWYASWFLPFAALLRSWPLLAVSVTVPLYFFAFPFYARNAGSVHEFAIAPFITGPALLWLAVTNLRRRLRPIVRPVHDVPPPPDLRVGVVIPARDEAAALPRVLAAIPPWVAHVVVADNGSRDATAQVAAAAGAIVVHEPIAGYGRACQAGLAALPPVDVVVFIDGDASDRPEEMGRLVWPIAHAGADLVIGSRVLGAREPGALTPQQRVGNWIACRLIGLVWGVSFSDLGPFRAIRAPALARLRMSDRSYGWTVEMQARAAALGLVCAEVPVSYRRRIGRSKISGTLRGVVMAGVVILRTLARETVLGPPPPLTGQTPPAVR